MAEASEVKKANVVPHAGDHDRIAMLSLNADGTADQHNAEVIIAKDEAVSAAKVQFAQQAVSAVDVAERGATAGTSAVTLVGQSDGSVEEQPLSVNPDPSTEVLKKKHDEAAKAAEASAEKIVVALIKD